ncbi:MAG: hypothetical protein NTV30_05420, partial [Chloroflexi bacterium]|nr:hypothetical protein [Chloroflexota bacterium]
ITDFEAAVYGENVIPILDENYNIVGWNVIDRSIYGTVSGDLRGTFVITYSGTLDLFEQGDIAGTLQINTTSGNGNRIYSSFSGSTYLLNDIDPVWGPIPYVDENGYYFAIAFITDQLTINGGTGTYKRATGSGSFAAGPENPVKAYFDETGYPQVQNGSALNLVGTLIRK